MTYRCPHSWASRRWWWLAGSGRLSRFSHLDEISWHSFHSSSQTIVPLMHRLASSCLLVRPLLLLIRRLDMLLTSRIRTITLLCVQIRRRWTWGHDTTGTRSIVSSLMSVMLTLHWQLRRRDIGCAVSSIPVLLNRLGWRLALAVHGLLASALFIMCLASIILVT